MLDDVERKHLAVRIDAVDASYVGDQAGDLRRLVGVVIVFLGVDEILVLELLDSYRTNKLDGTEIVQLLHSFFRSPSSFL